MRVIIAGVLALLTFIGSAVAEDRSPRFLMKIGVLICDTEEQLREQLGKQSPIEGCGFTQKPMWVEVVRLDDYEHDGIRFALVRFEFPIMKQGETEVTMWQQYGFWGKPQLIKPVGLPI